MEKVLVVDDDDAFRETIRIFLTGFDVQVCMADNGLKALSIVQSENIDLILTDLKMPEMSGLELLEKVKVINKNIQVILITGFEDMKSTIKAMQLGAFDYIDKPINLERLKSVLKRALENKKISDRLIITADDSPENDIEDSLVGKTQIMKEIFKSIGKVSANRVNVLIQGDSGTGKEIVAKVIHYSGITKTQPFIPVNCTALTETLLESELFGHVKGSFTGATRDKKGKFELAGEGTIFLDEISEITHNLQVKLLRVLQEREFEKVGGETSLPMRARVIAATNRNLTKLVEEGKFRDDLYFRLKVFTIEVPPLKDRKQDIPQLVVHLLNRINKELHKNVRKIPYEVMEILQNYEWIGNVRELENTLLQAVVRAKGDVLEKENILLRAENFKVEEFDYSHLSMEEVEKIHIESVLKRCNWDKKKTLDILKITKPTLNTKIRKYNLIRK